jgi:hypothetical protein
LLTVTRGVDETGARFDEGTELPYCFLVGVVGRRAHGDELLGAKRQVELDLVFDFALPPIAPVKREPKDAFDARANHEVLELGCAFVATVRMFVTVSA